MDGHKFVSVDLSIRHAYTQLDTKLFLFQLIVYFPVPEYMI